MSLADGDAEHLLALMADSFAALDIVAAMAEPAAESPFARGAGHCPPGGENRFGGWARKARVEGAPQGPLAGRTVVLKDNIALAGVPMMNGSATLEGFVPREDATVVSRVLAAGGTIVGKAVCENFCMSGGSHTSDPGPVENPHRAGYSAGGSSSGCAALVAGGEADMAIGGDQGGSIRIPAAYCGLVGLKPTWGLVPYTGIMPIEATIDHTGPMTKTVADNALLLSVLAGPDGLDPRQTAVPAAGGDYRAAIGQPVAGLRIGLVREGFGCAGMDPAVAALARAAAGRLQRAGALCADIAVPEHVVAPAVWTPVATEGMVVQMMHGNGMGHGWKGRYDTGLMAAHAGWRQKANDLPLTLKVSMLVGEWTRTHYQGRLYARARNLAPLMRAAYDRALTACDVLAMPTLPRVASPLPGPDAAPAEILQRAAELNINTCPFDLTGHPALTLPCGTVDGLPAGLMLIGRHGGEAMLYRVAAQLEAMMAADA